MKSTTTGRIACITTAVVAATHPHAAFAGEVADAVAALSFWMQWGVVYLAIGAGLMAIATATAIQERRAWSSLLSWPADETAYGDAPPDSSRRAA